MLSLMVISLPVVSPLYDVSDAVRKDGMDELKLNGLSRQLVKVGEGFVRMSMAFGTALSGRIGSHCD